MSSSSLENYSKDILKEFPSISDVLESNTGFNTNYFIVQRLIFVIAWEIKVKEDESEIFEYAKKSIYWLDRENKVRTFCIRIVKHPIFDLIIICLIILNSLLLAIYDYEHPSKKSVRNNIVNYLEPVFTIAFTIEWVLKIIAMGFVFGKGTYLKDPWNWLDFIVVVTSWLSVLPSMANVSVIRTFRLFRPLRSFSSFPAMKSIITTLLRSTTKLGEIMILAFLFFYIFSILGLALWNGDIHQRWYQTPEPVNGIWELVPGDERLWGERKWEVGYWRSVIDQHRKDPDSISLDNYNQYVFYIFRFRLLMNLTFETFKTL